MPDGRGILLALQGKKTQGPLSGHRPAISPMAKPGCRLQAPPGPAFCRWRGKNPVLCVFQDFLTPQGGKRPIHAAV
jgi:hypothetical protein